MPVRKNEHNFDPLGDCLDELDLNHVLILAEPLGCNVFSSTIPRGSRSTASGSSSGGCDCLNHYALLGFPHTQAAEIGHPGGVSSAYKRTAIGQLSTERASS